jgi:hypothetical protein
MKNQKQTMIVEKAAGLKVKTNMKAGVRKAGEKPVEY